MNIISEHELLTRDGVAINFLTDSELCVVNSGEDSEALWGWLDNNDKQIDELLLKQGAVLFRGFNLSEIDRFEKIVDKISKQVIIGYGDLPEEKKTKKVYGSTPYPENMKILFHNESSHLNSWPVRQYFSCVTPSVSGGETPIVDCRDIYQKMEPAIREEFERKGLIYHRNFIPGLDVSWQDFYKTQDKNIAEQKIIDSGSSFNWLEDGSLLTQRVSQAVDVHPVTGEKVFFNQLMLHHPFFLKKEVRNALMMIYGEDKLPRSVKYGDGSSITDSTLEYIAQLYDQCAIEFSWKQGDLLVCDNMLVAHARNPFVGERKIIVGLSNPIELYR